MDILGILTNEHETLLDDDFAMFEEELAIGDYTPVYRSRCLGIIEKERQSRKNAKEEASQIPEAQSEPEFVLPSDVSSTVLVSSDKLSPYSDVEIPDRTPFEIVSSDISAIRRADKRKAMFREYLKNKEILDEALIDKHFSFFDEWEMGAILNEKQLSEEFLEKYFASLDHKRVARTQLFSEQFFMRHFNDFDVEDTLKRGKNPWCKKENRSKRFDTFLRLKGVRL